MKTNHYESVVIINAALEDAQIDSLIARIEEFIKSNGGTIHGIEKWGRKRLAYPIQKSKSGYYGIFRFEAKRDLISPLERIYRLDENIIRYLTIALDKSALENIAKQEKKKEEDAALAEIPEDKTTLPTIESEE
jgi:small subunit ribosomal protein S6